MRKLLLTASVLALGAMTMPASAETVRWARNSDALTLDPHSQNQGTTHTFMHHIYETLVDRDVEGNPHPAPRHRVGRQGRRSDGLGLQAARGREIP
jgi:peptide/nickel transport system substrate-binding protein